jgi:Zn-dependent peptidase ImmA (M78 family)/DNA-binding XRE family transcriptional regulator
MPGTQERFQQMVGERLKFARTEAGMTQEQLSAKLGFKDRQILANIEGGKRKVSAEELLQLIQILGKPMDYFTDSTLLVGEGAFCWRAPKASVEKLDQFETKARRWIATYRLMGREKGELSSPLVTQLAITERSSFEEARAAAEALTLEWRLGEVPADSLTRAVESALGVLVLWVDAAADISGAACKLNEFNTILVNRREPDGRRNFDFAHELFHLLTWEKLPPQRIDTVDPQSRKGKRAEQLANNFASALLMPETILRPRWEHRAKGDIHDWLNEAASTLCVTSEALYYRLLHLGWLSEGDSLEINRSRLTWNGRTPSEQTLPKPYSRRFLERLHWGIETGCASVRWTAKLLDTSIYGLRCLFEDYGMTVPFDL